MSEDILRLSGGVSQDSVLHIGNDDDAFLSLESLDTWVRLIFDLDVIEIESDADCVLWTSMFLRGFIRAAMLVIGAMAEGKGGE